MSRGGRIRLGVARRSRQYGRRAQVAVLRRMLRLLLHLLLTLLATWHMARLGAGSSRNNKVLVGSGWGESDGTEIGVSKGLSKGFSSRRRVDGVGYDSGRLACCRSTFVPTGSLVDHGRPPNLIIREMALNLISGAPLPHPLQYLNNAGGERPTSRDVQYE